MRRRRRKSKLLHAGPPHSSGLSVLRTKRVLCTPICRERVAKLAQVKLVPEDVDFYVNNCCCDKAEAEKALRQAEGDLKAALVAFAKA